METVLKVICGAVLLVAGFGLGVVGLVVVDYWRGGRFESDNEFRFDDEMPLNVPRKAADETNNR